MVYYRRVNANFTTTKWMCLFLLAPLALTFVLRGRSFRIPSGVTLWLIGGLAATRALAFIFNPGWASLENVFDSLAFGCFVLYFLNSELKKRAWLLPFLLMLGTITAFCLSGYFEAENWASPQGYLNMLGTFGNVNMLSEFLLLLLPFISWQISYHREKRSPIWQRYLYQLCLLTTLSLLWLGHSRSAWISMGLWFCMEIFHRLHLRPRYYALIGVFAIIVLGVLTHEGSINAQKQASTKERQLLYVASWNMLLDSPLGVGGNNYEFSFTPYQLQQGLAVSPGSIFTNPHNEFLEWGIEQGWAYLVLILMFFIALLIYVFNNQATGREQLFQRSVIAVFFAPVMFQFPFSTPASQLWMAFLLAWIGQSLPLKEVTLSPLLKLGGATLAVLLLVRGGAYSASRLIEGSRTPDLEVRQIGCDVYPPNWRGCNAYIELLVERHEFSEAKKRIADEFKKRPYNWMVPWSLGSLSFQQSHTDQACGIAKGLEVLFHQRVSYGPQVDHLCDAYSSPIEFKNTEQFKASYLQWTQSLFNEKASQ